MMKLLDKALVILLLPALSKLSLAVVTQYQLVNEQKTWIEAQSYCREFGGDLATITSAEDLQKVDNLIQGHAPKVWIGLYDDELSWKWSLDGTYVFDEDGNSAFDNWMTFSTDNYASSEHCAELVNGNIYDKSCETSYGSVCYDEPSNTYIQVNTPMTWKDAQSNCRTIYTDLASIRNVQEKAAMPILGTSLWVGLYRNAWKWSDQSDMVFSSWASGEPNNYARAEHCARHQAPSIWNDMPCGFNYPFVCSFPVHYQKVIKIGLNAGGLMDPNDVGVQQAILKQIEKRLKDQGITANITLKWQKQSDGLVFHKEDNN